MELTREQLDALYEMTVVTADGHSLGPVGHIYLDDDSQQATWVTSRTGLFGLREVFVPFQGAHIDAEAITVRFTKDAIMDAPRIAADGHISEAEQLELFEYYTRENHAQDGTPAHAAPAQPHPPQPTDGRDPVSTVAADSPPAADPASADPTRIATPAAEGQEPADSTARPESGVQQTVDGASKEADAEQADESAAPEAPARDTDEEAAEPDPDSDFGEANGTDDDGGVEDAPGEDADAAHVQVTDAADGQVTDASDGQVTDADAPGQVANDAQASENGGAEDSSSAQPAAAPEDDGSADEDTAGADEEAGEAADADEQASSVDQHASRG